MKACCAKRNFERLTTEWSVLADPGSAEGVEFTTGRCTNCQQLLMHCCVGGGMAEGYVVVDRAFVERLAAQDAPSRKRTLAAWWDAKR